MKLIDVALSPSEFASLKQRDLSNSVCIVFDILRATTSMTEALANGADGVIPVSEISEAVAIHKQSPNVLLAGERHGVRILKKDTGSVDFNMGNSPREYVPAVVSANTIVTTTTNGTRALQACAHARRVFIGAFTNLSTLAHWVARNQPKELVLVCAGTYEEAAYEDILAAGALIDAVADQYNEAEISDSAHVTRQMYSTVASDILGAMRFSKNARRLLGMPELRDDVAFCLSRDKYNFIGEMKDGIVRKTVSA